jgi:hypothetical protein
MRKLFLCSAVALVAACGDGGSTSPPVAALTVAVPVPSIPVGQTVTLTAQSVSGDGVAAAASGVAWSSLDPAVATVSSAGVVTAVAPGVATITAAAASQTARADVYVSGGSVSCSASAAAAPSVGEVRLLAGSERSAICLPAVATGGEYALVAFNASSDTASRVFLGVSGERVVPVVGGPTPSVAPTAGELLASRAPAPIRVDGGAALALGAAVPDAQFHLALRGREQRQLRDRIPGAARSLASRRASPSLSVSPSAGAPAGASGALTPTAAPSLVTVPATKGALVRLNTESGSACNTPDYRGGRVVAVGERSIIVADTANPTGGFTDADYAGFAAAFDTLVYPTDVKYFGEPSDVDENKRSVIFFTRAVNELTRANSDSYVGGFFFGRAPFPGAADRGTSYPGCAGSNEAELFYMLVPDPTGVVNGNRRELAFVKGVTTGVLAHEFQHLINEGRRLYVNEARDFEDTWLNEGLSHVAEELMYFKVSGLEPRTNIDAAAVRSSQRRIDAFNDFQGSNFGRLRAYLSNPEANSPYAADDSLATRGATWQFLRYAADRTTGDETAVFKALVNSKLSGFQNLDAVFGGSTLNLARDWAVAQYTDDSNIGQNLRTSYTFASWNYRAVYAAFRDRAGNALPFPLRVTTLPSTGAPVQSTLVGGGATYLRFASAPGATATVRLTAAGVPVPESVQMVLVRTR